MGIGTSRAHELYKLYTQLCDALHQYFNDKGIDAINDEHFISSRDMVEALNDELVSVVVPELLGFRPRCDIRMINDKIKYSKTNVERRIQQLLGEISWEDSEPSSTQAKSS